MEDIEREEKARHEIVLAAARERSMEPAADALQALIDDLQLPLHLGGLGLRTAQHADGLAQELIRFLEMKARLQVAGEITGDRQLARFLSPSALVDAAWCVSSIFSSCFVLPVARANNNQSDIA